MANIGKHHLTPYQAQAVLAEWQKRQAAKHGRQGAASPILGELFPKQRRFVLDLALYRLIATLGTRRAGKTFMFSDGLVWTAEQDPRWDCLYLNPTAKQARDVMWEGPDGLKLVDKRHQVGIGFHNQTMTATLPNGARIFCGGAENREDIEQWRGRKFKQIIIDEAGSFKPHLEELITSVLQPTTADLQGTLVLGGTPGRILAGMFYDATRHDDQRNAAWRYHHISILDNPNIPHAQSEIDHILKANGWDKYRELNGQHHPTFRREWLGEWAREESTLVYKFPPDRRCLYTSLPPARHWNHILGIDFGYRAPTSFRVLSFSDQHPRVYLQNRIQKTKLGVTDIANIIKDLDQRFHFINIVADPGALAQQIIKELNERHGLSVCPAEKRHKADYIEMFNDDLRMGRIAVHPDDPIIKEWARLQWEDEERRIEDKRFPNHDADATLYGWRDAKHFTFTPEEAVPDEGDPEWPDHEARRMEESDVEQFGLNDDESPWWDKGGGYAA